MHAQTGLGLKTIVIDPGHGGKDPGAIGKKLKTMEKTVVLNVSLLLGELIQKNYPEIKLFKIKNISRFTKIKDK